MADILTIAQSIARLVKLEDIPNSLRNTANDEVANLIYLMNNSGRELVKKKGANGAGWIFSTRDFEFSLNGNDKTILLPSDCNDINSISFVETSSYFKPKFLFQNEWAELKEYNNNTNLNYYRIVYDDLTKRNKIEFFNAPSAGVYYLSYSSDGWLQDEQQNRFSTIEENTHNLLLDEDLYINWVVYEFKLYDGQPDYGVYLAIAENMLTERLGESIQNATIELGENSRGFYRFYPRIIDNG